jgi:hypothetical protein
MNKNEKKKIIEEACNGGDKGMALLAMAMSNAYCTDTAAVANEMREHVPADKLGKLALMLYHELFIAGCETSAKVCYSTFKNEINVNLEEWTKKFVEDLRKKDEDRRSMNPEAPQ